MQLKCELLVFIVLFLAQNSDRFSQFLFFSCRTKVKSLKPCSFVNKLPILLRVFKFYHDNYNEKWVNRIR